MIDIAMRMLLAAVSGALGERAENSNAWTYVIRSLRDESPYITRTLLPRVLGYRPVLHRIWRGDGDRHMHNYPWRTARFMIVSGGYTEERFMHVGCAPLRRRLRPGQVNALEANTFHRVSDVLNNTWTIGLLGPRVQEWGFLVDGEIVHHAMYFNAVAPMYENRGGVS